MAAGAAVLVLALAGSPRPVRRSVSPRVGALELVGATVRRPFGPWAPSATDRLVGTVVSTAVAGALVDVRLTPVAAFAVWALDVGRRRRRALDRRHAITRELPEVVDLFALAVAGGGTVHAALELVVARPLGPVSSRLADAHRAVQRGGRLADELEAALIDLGPATRPLIRSLAGAEHYGTSIEVGLQRIALEARDRRRRETETRARRVPVRLLGPLVLGVLPAFVLLTVVPTVVRTLDGLSVTAP